MSNAPLWLEYRPDRLDFAGGRPMKFGPSARMLYNPTENIIAIENPGTTVPPESVGKEIRRIEYAMLVNVPEWRGVIPFFHPLKAGSGVRVTTNDRGELFFMNDHGAPLFSKDWTLRDVSRDQIRSNRAVWQFHGYRHEH